MLVGFLMTLSANGTDYEEIYLKGNLLLEGSTSPLYLKGYLFLTSKGLQTFIFLPRRTAGNLTGRVRP